MENRDTFNDFMRDSEMRQNAINDVIANMEKESKRFFSEGDKNKLREVLACYEVEDGVSVFMVSSKPADKVKIAKVDLDKENVILWWGANRNKSVSSYRNAYGLGMTFAYKGKDETIALHLEELKEQYPIFTSCFSNLTIGATIKLVVYSNAGDFYQAVKNRQGKWLLQEPTETGSFIPYRPIGKEFEGNEMHLFQPNSKMKVRSYSKNIKII